MSHASYGHGCDNILCCYGSIVSLCRVVGAPVISLVVAVRTTPSKPVSKVNASLMPPPPLIFMSSIFVPALSFFPSSLFGEFFLEHPSLVPLVPRPLFSLPPLLSGTRLHNLSVLLLLGVLRLPCLAIRLIWLKLVNAWSTLHSLHVGGDSVLLGRQL